MALVAFPTVLVLNYFFLGPWQETVILYGLTYMYNDLRGGDEHFVVRDLIIALAFGVYNRGSLAVACGPDHGASELGYVWLVIISGVIFTTMHIQDMKDQAGDRERNRHTVPLVLGDGVARYTVSVTVLFWSFACPLFLKMGFIGSAIPVTLGLSIANHTLWKREPKHDQRSWDIWAAWLIVLYGLPFSKNVGIHFLETIVL